MPASGREFGELIATMMMVQTPVIVINATFVLLAAYLVRSGIEVIARILELTQPWVILLFSIVLLFGLQKTYFRNLLPVLKNGIKPVLMGPVTPSAWRGEVMLLAMLLPFVDEPGKGKILGIWGVLLLGIILVFDALINTAVFG